MRAEVVDLSGVDDRCGLARRVVAKRADEVMRLSQALAGRDKGELHDFRIACKRLRYALERFSVIEPSFAQMAEHFAGLQDALGQARDRDVLLTILPPAMGDTQRRLQREREVCVIAADVMWEALRETAQRLVSHQF